MDGYRIAGRTGRPQVASIKGVIADELRFERGLTRTTMSMQAAWEVKHVRRADLVLTTSSYAAHRIQELYGSPTLPRVVPEAIDLVAWRGLLARHAAAPQPDKFIVLTVCRFYPRKRLDLLLAAAERLGGNQTSRLRPSRPKIGGSAMAASTPSADATTSMDIRQSQKGIASGAINRFGGGTLRRRIA